MTGDRCRTLPIAVSEAHKYVDMAQSRNAMIVSSSEAILKNLLLVCNNLRLAS